jgi:rhodanese-related sulfurtransferase
VIQEVSPRKAKARLHSSGEIAFLDVREAGQFGEGHPLFAVPCPYSRLELMAPRLVPNPDVPVLLIDAGDGVAERAARRLEALGYSDIGIVAGGALGWAEAGLTLFKGVNVPSKTLGELAEAVWHPATIDATALRNWQDESRPFRFFDARPPAEHAKMRVPGAACLPNGELAHRIAAAVPDESMPVVITCAGRTRGLMGAIGLKLVGIGNPVYALENGTQGWALAGEILERGAAPEPYPALSKAAAETSRERARAVCAQWRIEEIDAAKLATFRADPSRTTYLFDVRSAEEFAAGHLPGAVHAPGGQLVQAADQWIGVRRARLVLADDTGLRAALAAFWLRQMGWGCFVLAGLVPPLPRIAAEEKYELPLRKPAETWDALSAGTCRLLDLRSSEAHRAGHPAGAEWVIRPTLPATPALSPPEKSEGNQRMVVLLAEEPAIAGLAAIDFGELGWSEVHLLEGGMEAWRAAGLPVETSPDRPPPAEAIDFLQFVHDRHDGNLESSRRYLAWEQGLVAQLDAEERAEFRMDHTT